MATAPPLTAPANKLTQETERAGAGAIAAEQALVPSPHLSEEGDLIALSGPVARLPVELDVAVPGASFACAT
jgi:hypothetical protein